MVVVACDGSLGSFGGKCTAYGSGGLGHRADVGDGHLKVAQGDFVALAPLLKGFDDGLRLGVADQLVGGYPLPAPFARHDVLLLLHIAALGVGFRLRGDGGDLHACGGEGECHGDKTPREAAAVLEALHGGHDAGDYRLRDGRFLLPAELLYLQLLLLGIALLVQFLHLRVVVLLRDDALLQLPVQFFLSLVIPFLVLVECGFLLVALQLVD